MLLPQCRIALISSLFQIYKESSTQVFPQEISHCARDFYIDSSLKTTILISSSYFYFVPGSDRLCLYLQVFT